MISALVVNRNGARWLEHCLASLGEPPPSDLEVVLVDNASDDGSQTAAARRFPHLRLLQMGHNVGFGVANNLAAACARGDLLLLLNNDAWLEPGALEEMRRVLEADPRLALVAPQLVGTDGRPRFSWAPDRGLLGEAVQRLRNPFEGSAFNHGPVERLLRRLLGPGWYTAACVLVRRRAFDEVGGFDPAFFLYFEDVDLCLRLRARGWRLGWAPQARVVHASGGGRLDAATELHYRRSQVHYYAKHRTAREQAALRRRLDRRYPGGALAAWLRDDRPGRRARRQVASAEAVLAAGERLPATTRQRLERVLQEARSPTATRGGGG